MQLDFAKLDGLLPAIVQDATTKEVLMVGFMNRGGLGEDRCGPGTVTFWSRTRQTLWTKGETSGNFLVVPRARTDCDDDTVLIEAEPKGPTCHTGAANCFFNEIPVSESDASEVRRAESVCAAQGQPRSPDAQAVRGGRPAGPTRRRQRVQRDASRDPRIARVKILRPQEIPIYVEQGYFDLGITGLDWVRETDTDVVDVMELGGSGRETGVPVKIVLAVPQASPVASARDLPAGTRDLHRVPRADPPLLREARDPGRGLPLVRRDRGQGAGDRRRDRRRHRDRLDRCAATG